MLNLVCSQSQVEEQAGLLSQHELQSFAEYSPLLMVRQSRLAEAQHVRDIGEKDGEEAKDGACEAKFVVTYCDMCHGHRWASADRLLASFSSGT